MKTERRQLLLKIATATVVGLFLLDYVLIEPAIAAWKKQSVRITALRENVERGRQLREREPILRERWAGMLRVNLPSDAESVVYKAWDRWVRESQIIGTSFTPTPWQTHEEGFETMECRVAVTGSQAALGRFIYELETDQSVPVSLEECEFTTRDPRGSQLTLTARITFLRLKETSKATAP